MHLCLPRDGVPQDCVTAEAAQYQVAGMMVVTVPLDSLWCPSPQDHHHESSCQHQGYRILHFYTAVSLLDNKMMALDSNLKFNAYVQAQVIALYYAQGEIRWDLLINVLKGYEMAQDANFTSLFVNRKKMLMMKEWT
jgi:hypothetical protein